MPTPDFEEETRKAIEAIRAKLGQPVPLSTSYVAAERPTLTAIDENDRCTLRFRNGAMLTEVPLRDLVDGLSYWRVWRK